jgi:hypothetical protein
MLFTVRVASMLLASTFFWSGRTIPHRSSGRIPLTLTFAPSTLVGGTATTATVTLGTPAPGGGATVTITNPPGTTVQAGAAQVGTIQSIGSTKIKVDGGQQSVTFRVLTAGVAAGTVATFTASSGNDQATATLTVNPASLVSVSIAPATMLGGTNATGTVTLDGPAPAGTGATIQLAGTVTSNAFLSDGSVRTVSAQSPFLPTTVTVPPGGSSATFAVTTTPVSPDQTITVSATLGNSARSTTFVVKAPVVTALLLNPSTVVAGNSATGTIVLNGPAPVRGLTSPLSASNTNATVPTTVTVPAGTDRQTFQITTPPLTTFGTAGNTVSISASARLSTSGTVSSISDGTSNTILPTTSNPSAILTLLPTVSLASVAASPSPVTGGSPISVSLTFTREATTRLATSTTTSTTTTAGTAHLKVDQPTIVQLPSSVVVPIDAGTVTVAGTTTAPVADQNVVITATLFSSVATTLTVKKPIPVIATFSLRPTTVTGGLNLIASLQLSTGITTAQVVSLSTDRTDLILLPATVTVPVSSVPTPFTFKTNHVSAQTTATVTATAGSQRIPIVVTIVP